MEPFHDLNRRRTIANFLLFEFASGWTLRWNVWNDRLLDFKRWASSVTQFGDTYDKFANIAPQPARLVSREDSTHSAVINSASPGTSDRVIVAIELGSVVSLMFASSISRGPSVTKARSTVMHGCVTWMIFVLSRISHATT